MIQFLLFERWELIWLIQSRNVVDPRPEVVGLPKQCDIG
jgi:hypothetical protein